MGFGIGNKIASLVKVIHLNGLESITISDADIRTDKVSIDMHGNKIIGNATKRFFENNTLDGDAFPNDINIDKTLYVNGTKIIGQYNELTVNDIIRGSDFEYIVASGNTINAGDFVQRVGSTNTVSKINTSTDLILGIAITGGNSGSTITVRIPYA